MSEVKRCEAMERVLRFVETEIVRENIEIAEQREDAISAPAPREMVELESNLTTIENNLKEVNTNYVALRKNHLELTELKNMLSKTESFLSEHQFNIRDSAAEDERGLLDGEKCIELLMFYLTSLIISEANEGDKMLDLEEQSYGSMKFNITAGVIERSRLNAFETMLWRVSFDVSNIKNQLLLKQ